MLRKFRFSLLGLLALTTIVAVATWLYFRPHRIELRGEPPFATGINAPATIHPPGAKLTDYGIQNPPHVTQGIFLIHFSDKISITVKRELNGSYKIERPIVADLSNKNIWVEVQSAKSLNGPLYELFFEDLKLEMRPKSLKRDEKIAKAIANLGHFREQGVQVYPYYLITSKNRVLYGYDGHGGMHIFEKLLDFASDFPKSPSMTAELQTLINDELSKTGSR